MWNNWVAIKQKSGNLPSIIRIEGETEFEYSYYDQNDTLQKVNKGYYHSAKISVYVLYSFIAIAVLSPVYIFGFQFLNIGLVKAKDVILAFSSGPTALDGLFILMIGLLSGWQGSSYVKTGIVVFSIPGVVYLSALILTVYLHMGYGYVRTDGIYLRDNLLRQERYISWHQLRPVAHLRWNTQGKAARAWLFVSDRHGHKIDLLNIPFQDDDYMEQATTVVRLLQKSLQARSRRSGS